MNFYGETNGPEYQVFGRVAPICEALHRAVLRATGKTLEPPALSKAMPEWCHNIADRLVLTIFKRLAGLDPQGKFDARNFGRMVGVILRGIIHFSKEVPAQLKREGLLDLSPEKEKKVESMIDMPAIVAFATEKLGQPISNEDELVKAGTVELERKVELQRESLFSIVHYLLDRPVKEQHEFLCGIPEGFILMLDNDGGYAGQRPRTDLYRLLLSFWPEITEMQKADPPKTCKFLLDWLEKQEGKEGVDDEGLLKQEPKKLVDDAKQFYGLCGEIGLVMGPPGHPHKSPPA
jgi:hypothetical protein